MKIIEAINEADALKANALPETIKIKWLSRLDQKIKQEIIDTHELNEGEEEPVISDYTPENTETELLVPEPYAEMYIHWLSAQIDYYNMELDGFNAANAMFESVHESFRNAYNASHRPKGAKKRYF
jgi:hypothetical protein